MNLQIIVPCKSLGTQNGIAPNDTVIFHSSGHLEHDPVQRQRQRDIVTSKRIEGSEKPLRSSLEGHGIRDPSLFIFAMSLAPQLYLYHELRGFVRYRCDCLGQYKIFLCCIVPYNATMTGYPSQSNTHTL